MLAFAVMHLAFRAFKRFTALGQLEFANDVDVSPALAMIVVAAACILLRRGRLADFGITLRPYPYSVTVGLAALLVYAAIGAGAIASGLRIDRTWTDPVIGAIVTSLNLLVSVIMICVLARIDGPLRRTPVWLRLASLAALAITAMALRARSGNTVPGAILAGLGLVVLAATAEEVFFRGYMQSRLNQAFGRPWRAFGVAFGNGLLIAALLFGMIHVLNTYDYFRGEGRLAWWWGLAAASNVFFGLLREKTGSIVTPAILHVCINLAARTGLASGDP